MSIILKMIFNNKTRSFRLETNDWISASDEEVLLKTPKIFSGSHKLWVIFRYLEQVYPSKLFRLKCLNHSSDVLSLKP